MLPPSPSPSPSPSPRLAGARLLAAAALSLGAVACGPPPKDPALEGYERFLGAVRTGNAGEVWRRLTPASQQALALRVGDPGPARQDPTADVRAVARGLGLPVEAPVTDPVVAALGVRPGWQFELDLPQSAALETATASEDRRVVVGPLGGARWRIPLLRVEGQWRVDLFAATPAAPSAPGGG